MGPTLPVARLLQATTSASASLVLVAGGFDGASLTDASLYDALTDSFRPAPALLRPRNRASATRLLSGDVLLAGGDATRPSAEVLICPACTNPDMAATPDLSVGPADFSIAPADLSVGPADFTTAPVDLATAPVDTGSPIDDTVPAPPDLAQPSDFAAVDLSPSDAASSDLGPGDLAGPSPRPDLTSTLVPDLAMPSSPLDAASPSSDAATPVTNAAGCGCVVGRSRGGTDPTGLLSLGLLAWFWRRASGRARGARSSTRPRPRSIGPCL
jgi:hypothetical protein